MPIDTNNDAEQTKNISADDLKQRFATQSLPSSKDYADLIDLADSSRKAAGLAPEQVVPDRGLWMVGDQLHIDDEAPIKLNNGSLQLNITDPLTVDNNGNLSIKLNQEMTVWSNKLAAKQARGIRSYPGNLSIELAANSGLEIVNGGLKVKNVIPKNLIIMYHGKDIPSGWALCDGTQGTPDLQNKFLVGLPTGEMAEESSANFIGTATPVNFYKLVYLMKL